MARTKQIHISKVLIALSALVQVSGEPRKFRGIEDCMLHFTPQDPSHSASGTVLKL